MFGSDIELDFDDDFPFDTFCKKVTTNKGDALEKGRGCDPQPNIAKRGPSLPPNQPCKADSNPSTKTGSGGAFVFAPVTSHEGNSLKRPHVQDEKPQKKRLSHEGLLQRKFPGPAGLLPDKPFRHISDFPLPMVASPSQETDPDKDNRPLYSQSSGSVFLQPPYHQLLTDFSLPDPANPLNKYTVDWLKRTALTKGLQGRKVPFLGLVVHAVNHTMPDPVLVLRDPTGEITGSLHREVWAEMGPKLRAGIALALRQVGVLITGVIRRQIYLNITMNNVLAVYSPSGGERGVDITTVNKVSHSELLGKVERWRGGPRRPPLTPVEGWNEGGSGKEGLKEGGEEVLREWGIVLGEGDFREEMRVPEGGGLGCSEGLSPVESMILEEVLSGIDPDEFEK